MVTINGIKLKLDRTLSRGLWSQVGLLAILMVVAFVVANILMSLSPTNWEYFCNKHHISRWVAPLYLLIDGNAFTSVYQDPSPATKWTIILSCIIYIIGIFLSVCKHRGILCPFGLGDVKKFHRLLYGVVEFSHDVFYRAEISFFAALLKSFFKSVLARFLHFQIVKHIIHPLVFQYFYPTHFFFQLFDKIIVAYRASDRPLSRYGT